MRRIFSASLALLISLPAFAHVTPNVTLVRRGDFVKESFPGASKFFEKPVALDAAQRAAIRSTTGWTPTEEESKVYVARDAAGKLVGTAIFLWMPSQHGPVGVAVAFDPQGVILRAIVTDVGTEPLPWVQALLRADGTSALNGLPLDRTPDAAQIGGNATGSMSRYYARVIADGVARAQALERFAQGSRT